MKNKTIKETHKYWCGECEEPFIISGEKNIVTVCPNCGSDKFGLDEPIIRTPKK